MAFLWPPALIACRNITKQIEAKFKTSSRPSATWTRATTATSRPTTSRCDTAAWASSSSGAAASSALSGDGAQRVSFDDFARLYDHTGMTPPPRTQTGAAPVRCRRREAGCGLQRGAEGREPLREGASRSTRTARALTSAELAAARAAASPRPQNRQRQLALYTADNMVLTTPSSPRASQARAPVPRAPRPPAGRPSRATVAACPVSKAQAPPPPRGPARSSRPSSAEVALRPFSDPHASLAR